MDYIINENKSVFSQRTIIIFFAAVILVCLAASITLFIVTDQWERRVLFFPNLNTAEFEGEIRYFPKLKTRTEDVRLLLEDLLLGSSNYGNSNVLPAATKLLALNRDETTLYIGFSNGVYDLENNVFTPRQMLQGVANTIFFNFTDIREIRFFIDGNEISDVPVQTDAEARSYALKHSIGVLQDLKTSLKTIKSHPVLSTPARTDYFLFNEGAKFDDSIF